MNRDKIKQILPHRDNMLLIDEVVLDGDISHGKYTVCGDEFFLKGHFPGNPTVPGVILCEILAQSACVLIAKEATREATPLFTGLEHVKFRLQVKPSDTLETTCEITRRRGSFYFAKGTGTVDGRLAISAEFSFALIANS